VAGNHIDIQIDTSAINARLASVLRALEHTQPLMLKLAETLLAHTQQTFEEEGYPAGSWTPLKKSTIRNRTRNGYWPGKILQQIGQLVASIHPEAGIDYAQVATNLPYARIQHEGGTIQRQGVIRLRTDARDNLVRQRNHKNLAVFAKASHKRATERQVNYQITIPARRYFPVTPDGQLIPRTYQAVIAVLDRMVLNPK
jgi:phage virion morphogenesis protein